MPANAESLAPREQDRLDALLGRARAFHALSWAIAIGAVVIPSRASAATLPAIATPAILLAVVALSAIALRLRETASPFVAMDPRRPPFAWIGAEARPGAEARALVHLLLPVTLAGAAASYPLPGGPWRPTLLFAPILLALIPRALDRYYTALVANVGVARRTERLSSWLGQLTRLGQSLGFGLFLVALIVAVVPRVSQALLTVAFYAMAAVVLLWVVGLGVELFSRTIDRFGARLGFLVWQSEIPAETFRGKRVAEVLATFGVAAAALTLNDEPTGKLRQVTFETRLDGERVGVRLHLEYNAKRLFSAERKWDPAVILAAEVEKLEYVEQRRGAPETPRSRAVTKKIPMPRT